jgi:hypothetical protein
MFSLSNDAAILLGSNPKLVELGTNKEIGNQQPILATKYYRFHLTRYNTLILACDRNTDTYTNEQEFVEDFGRNLDAISRSQLSDRWKEVG